jgi:transcriptional regulator GlxA family with amidase domain
MRLTELGLHPATLASLHHAGIDSTHELLEHSCRELTWHSAISGQQLYEIIRQLNQHKMMLSPTPGRITRQPGERNLEIFRLRVAQGLTLKETAESVGLSVERVRQLLAAYYGLRGSPPAVKARKQAGRQP